MASLTEPKQGSLVPETDAIESHPKDDGLRQIEYIANVKEHSLTVTEIMRNHPKVIFWSWFWCMCAVGCK